MPRHGAQYVPNGVVSPSALAKALGISRQRADQLLHKERFRARQSLLRAIRRGTITKPTTCEECGKEDAMLQGHHGDYTKQLQVQWVCSACHALIHPHPARSIRQRICSSCGNDVKGNRLLCEDCRPVGIVTRQCEQCGQPFQVQRSSIRPGTHIPRIYCSRQCLYESHRVTVRCAQCGVEVSRQRSSVPNGPTGLHFCGQPCHLAWNGIHLREFAHRNKPKEATDG